MSTSTLVIHINNFQSILAKWTQIVKCVNVYDLIGKN